MSPPETKKERIRRHPPSENGPGSLAFATFSESKVERELAITDPLPLASSLNQQRGTHLLEPYGCQRFRFSHISVV
jgi:hypothetical protein